MPKIKPGPDPTFDDTKQRPLSVGLGDRNVMPPKQVPTSGVSGSFAPEPTERRVFGIDQGDQYGPRKRR